MTPSGAPQPSGVRRLGTVPGLDGLRGIAVLLVVASHSAVVAPTGVTEIQDFFRGGFLGVDLFFVLSGFLITALLLGEEAQNGRIRVGAFYARRALRLLPALFVLLGVDLLYAWLTSDNYQQVVDSVAPTVFYYSNWKAVADPLFVITPSFGHLWSLAIEEQFYFVWPAFVIAFLGLRRRGWVAASIIVVLIAVVAVNRAVRWGDGTFWGFLTVRTDTHADGLLVGCLLASLWVRGLLPRRGVATAAWVATIGLLVCFEVVVYDEAFVFLGGYTLIAVAIAVVILATLDTEWAGKRFLELRPLRAVGRVSYGLYLWHFPLLVVVLRYGQDWSPMARIVVWLAGCALATTLSWFVVERPALRLKKRFEPRRGPAPEREVQAGSSSNRN